MTNTPLKRPRALPAALLLCCLIAAAAVLPVRVLAQDTSPAAPESAQLPMQPGDIHAVQMLAGDEAVYKLDVEQVGRYRLTTGLLPVAQQVQVTISAAGGDPLFANPFTPIDLTLRPGTYEFTFAALDDATFDFAVVRHHGTYSVNPAVVRHVDPGQHLPSQSLDVPNLHAQLRIPEQAGPTEWILRLEDGPAAPFQLRLQGADLDLSEEVRTEATLSFWSAGGLYDMVLERSEGGIAPSFTLLQPSATELTPLYLNSVAEGTLAPNRKTQHFRLTLDDGVVANLALDSDFGGDLDLSVQPLSEPTRQVARSATPLSTEHIGELLLTPDSYLVTVTRTAGQGPARFRLELGVEPVQTFFSHAGGQQSASQGEDDPLNLHGFHVPAAGQQVTLELKSPAIVAAHGLVFGRQRQVRDNMLASPVTFLAPAAGDYYIGVDTRYGFGYYTLDIGIADPPARLPEMGVVAREIEPGGVQHWRYPVPENAHLISFVLVSLSDQDLDLESNRYDPDSHELHFRTSSMDPKVETVAWYDPAGGEILVTVSSFGTRLTEYLLVVRTQTLDSR
ncbi:MAG: hypothetical protein OXC13_11740 [Caldilineaceae bacterium]|nr:hypothetical protein [Caldilineaceae bacterium]